MSAITQRTALYRLFDADDILLYVGISYQPYVRFTQHADTKAWFREVARTDIEWHETREMAEAAEATAIRTELPRYNLALPDADGHYRTGVGRPPFTPNAEQEQLIQQAIEAKRRRDEGREQLWAAILRAWQVGVPVAALADRQKVFSKATIYRRLRTATTIAEA